MRVIILLSALTVSFALNVMEKNQFILWDANKGPAGSGVNITDDSDNWYFNSSGMPNHELDDSINPNAATAQSHTWTIPKNPTVRADGPSCVPELVGFSLAGKFLLRPPCLTFNQ